LLNNFNKTGINFWVANRVGSLYLLVLWEGALLDLNAGENPLLGHGLLKIKNIIKMLLKISSNPRLGLHIFCAID